MMQLVVGFLIGTAVTVWVAFAVTAIRTKQETQRAAMRISGERLYQQLRIAFLEGRHTAKAPLAEDDRAWANSGTRLDAARLKDFT